MTNTAGLTAVDAPQPFALTWTSRDSTGITAAHIGQAGPPVTPDHHPRCGVNVIGYGDQPSEKCRMLLGHTGPDVSVDRSSGTPIITGVCPCPGRRRDTPNEAFRAHHCSTNAG